MRTRKKSWDQRRRERKLRMRQVLADESPEQKEIRLEHLRRYRRSVRDSESPEQREARLAHNREKMRRALARKRQEKAALQQQQQQQQQQPQQQQPQNKTGAVRRSGGRGVQRTWEALEEAARRLLGDRWELLETLMSERKSGISVEEASDLFPDEIQQGLIHACCLCNGLLFQRFEGQTSKGKAGERAAEERSQDQASEETPCPHTDTVQLFVV